jgi:hypothetical protein
VQLQGSGCWKVRVLQQELVPDAVLHYSWRRCFRKLPVLWQVQVCLRFAQPTKNFLLQVPEEQFLFDCHLMQMNCLLPVHG